MLRITSLSICIGLAILGGAAVHALQAGPKAEDPFATKGAPSNAPGTIVPELPPNLAPRQRERLVIARAIRDEKLRMNHDDPESFLSWQRRYDDLIAEALAADPGNPQLLKILEADVKVLVDFEQQYMREKEAGFASALDVMTVRLTRLDVEETLDRARAHRKGGGEAPKPGP